MEETKSLVVLVSQDVNFFGEYIHTLILTYTHLHTWTHAYALRSLYIHLH